MEIKGAVVLTVELLTFADCDSKATFYDAYRDSTDPAVFAERSASFHDETVQVVGR